MENIQAQHAESGAEPSGPALNQMQYPHRARRPGTKRTYVYCVAVLGTSPCKIGFAQNPWVRFEQIQTANHQRLELAAIIETTGQLAGAIERSLHKAFLDKRIRGEWFDASANEIIVVMETLGSVTIAPPAPRGHRYLRLKPRSMEQLLEAAACHPRWNVSKSK